MSKKGPWLRCDRGTVVIDGQINTYLQISDINRTLVWIQIVDHTDVVGATASPTTSTSST